MNIVQSSSLRFVDTSLICVDCRANSDGDGLLHHVFVELGIHCLRLSPRGFLLTQTNSALIVASRWSLYGTSEIDLSCMAVSSFILVYSESRTRHDHDSSEARDETVSAFRLLLMQIQHEAGVEKLYKSRCRPCTTAQSTKASVDLGSFSEQKQTEICHID